MDLHLLILTAVPVVAGVLVRLARRPQHGLAAAARALLDLITLWMVLRDTDPDQRGPLLHAHRTWRLPASKPPAARRIRHQR
ncbi:hypothetical protein ACFVYT_29050 [Streptomyces sp. NPDC058290]|uniref:hypothetical protein n=1 Tax=Streptomyces sp. NPDC058290 TaxID=3346426 RepID=UPI0036E5CFEC